MMKEYVIFFVKLGILMSLAMSLETCIFSRQYYGLSEEDYNYIKKETSGGELDFESRLDKSKTYFYDAGEFDSREWALLMWGKAVRALGVKNRLDAVMLYEEITGSELSPEESRALKTGFDIK